MKRGGRKGRERVLDVGETTQSLARCVCTVIRSAADDFYKIDSGARAWGRRTV